MEPTLEVKDQFLVNKLSYLFSRPSRGDIVLLEAPYLKKDMIKRVIGMPGDNFSIDGGQVYIDGEPLEEEYTSYEYPEKIFMCDTIKEFTIPRDEYFVMGDNRDLSRDSRDWLEDPGLQSSTVSGDSIKGKVLIF